jgi:hypothetical protein
MRTCDQVNAFLSTFGDYKAKRNSRMAYEVKESDRIIPCADESFGILHTDKGRIKFIRSAELVSYQVFPGDFIEIIQWPNCAVHWEREHFLAQNVQPDETVIKRGDAVLEHYEGTDQLITAGSVIKIADRYFVEIKNNRVLTAWSINGAARFYDHNHALNNTKKLQKTLAELEARKKNPQVVEVGFWSRTVEEVQGGAA